ncbi:unnamed protein product [Urochloa decumbens]|uniref:AAA+ ATPase domain-containing protein n=1 Tax=Urochloa decumbens TaxID=240449 RepID=A0ABC9GXV3_9POAL
MEFASVALGSLLPKLSRLLQEEYHLQTGAKKGIRFLYEELERTQAALRQVGAEVPLPCQEHQLSELVRLWARDVREVSYDMEDIVDTFMVRVQGSGPLSKSSVKRFIKKMSNIVDFATKAKARRQVAKQVESIKERVSEVADRRDRYKLDATITPANTTTTANKTLVDPRITALYTEASELGGIGEAKEEVITMLTKDDADQQGRILVSIAGFGGLGKTTLAKAVHDEIRGQFDCTAFVSVSRNPDAKKLLKDMMYQLDKEKYKSSLCANLDEIRHLIDLVREALQNKRYLIVIDDIWDKEPWDVVIRHALIKNNMRSRIITTTRIIDVAKHIGGCYRLKPLSDESSQTLFYGRIFGSKDKCPRQYFEVSQKILKKCGGVPLAIVTTSSLLANKSDNIKEWFNLSDSIGSGLGTHPGIGSMRNILMLSYYDLPSHLKTCLLYLSIFPEDYEIRKDRLIWRWVAEGFAQDKKGDQCFLEIGESYFNELLNRSMIQPARVDMEGTPHACRVHDIVLDLITSLSVEECFSTTVLGDGMESKACRLSIHNNTTWPNMKMPKLRSLTIFEPADVATDPVPSLSRYRLLRVLDLGRCRLNKKLASLGFLGSLSHLRYLGLSSRTDARFETDELPVEIGKLRFLQTLDVSNTAVIELPLSITKARQLTCLRGCRCIRGRTKLPYGLKNLTSLEVLESVFVTSECIVEELGHLIQLRVLKVAVSLVSSMDGAKVLLESLGKLTKIEYIEISAGNLDGSMAKPLGNLRWLRLLGFMFLPTWIKGPSLPVLSYLHVTLSYERREDIQVLGTLPCLRRLKFVVTRPRRQDLERCVVGPDAFPCVVSCDFDIEGGGVLPCMFPRGSMPRLQDFKFNIASGSVVDDQLGLAHLPCLRSVTVLVTARPIVTALGHTHHKASADDVSKDKVVREKLDHEAAVHPNHPLRIQCTRVLC